MSSTTKPKSSTKQTKKPSSGKGKEKEVEPPSPAPESRQSSPALSTPSPMTEEIGQAPETPTPASKNEKAQGERGTVKALRFTRLSAAKQEAEKADIEIVSDEVFAPEPKTPAMTRPVLTSSSVGSRPTVFREGLLDLLTMEAGTATPTAPQTNVTATNPTTKPWTTEPAAGWPKTNANDPKWRLDRWSPASIIDINAMSDKSVLSHFWGLTLAHHKFQEAKEDLLECLKLILGADEEPKIFEPTMNLDPKENPKGTQPATFAITNLSPVAKQKLLDQGVFSLSDPQITFFIHEIGWEIPEFITLLQGFSSFHDHGSLRASIKATIDADTPTRELIHRLVTENPNFNDMSAIDVMRAVISSVQIDVLPIKAQGGLNDYKVGVYMMSPTANGRSWNDLKNQIRSLTFRIYKNGDGTKFDLDPCLGCRATNHPMGLCPYLAITGWNGLYIEKHRDDEDTTPWPNKAIRYDDEGPSEYYGDRAKISRGGPRGGSRGGPRGGSRGGPRGGPRGGYGGGQRGHRGRGGRSAGPSGSTRRHDDYSYYDYDYDHNYDHGYGYDY